jgi:hypothetical protein
MSDSEYLEKFRTQLKVLKAAGGQICVHPGMVSDKLLNMNTALVPTEDEIEVATKQAQQRFEGALFLAHSHKGRYGRLIQELANDYNKSRDGYPASLTEAYELMLHDVHDEDARACSNGVGGMAFAQDGAGTNNETTSPTPSGNGPPASNAQPNPRPGVTCHRCGKRGHFGNRCKESAHANGTTLVTAGSANASNGSNDTDAGEPTVDAATVLLLLVIDDDVTIDGFQFLQDAKATMLAAATNRKGGGLSISHT